MSRKYPESALACPACHARNDDGVGGLRLLNPIGCDEMIVFIICSSCRRGYLEVEEDGFAHDDDGPDYWTRGPIDPIAFEELANLALDCPDSMYKFCDCEAHAELDELMYGRMGRNPGAAEVSPEPHKLPLEIDCLRDGPAAFLRERVSGRYTGAPEPTPKMANDLAEMLKRAAPDAKVTGGIKSMQWARDKLVRKGGEVI